MKHSLNYRFVNPVRSWLEAVGLLVLVAAVPPCGYFLFSLFGTYDPIDVVLLKEGTEAKLKIVSLDEYAANSGKSLDDHLAGGRLACQISLAAGPRIYVDGGNAWFEDRTMAAEIAWQLAQCIKSDR